MSYDLLLWLSLLLAGYTFAGYPLLVIWRAGRAAPAPSAAPDPAPDLPNITVVVAARNEAARIGARVQNLLDSDYPPHRLQVLVADDGSNDGTADVVREFGDPRVRVHRLEQAGGKATAITAAMAVVDSEITVFADARQRFAVGALRELARPFADESIGAVAGELVIGDASTAAKGHAVASNGIYWKIERSLREAEARLGWAHAASGAIYAIRTSLFRPIPPGLLLDDMYTPLQIVRQGQRICMARSAVAFDSASDALGQEFRRKLRTLTGNWQLIAAQPWLLSPRRNPVFFAWVSHKFARLVAPWALLAALLTAALAVGPLAQLAFWLQLAAYLLAIAAIVFPHATRRIPLAGAAGSFLALNAAALLSLPVWLGRRDLGQLWKR
jgi:poly-beta-1,6-N-acetyl-D-glucosamine synthase